MPRGDFSSLKGKKALGRAWQRKDGRMGLGTVPEFQLNGVLERQS